LKEQTTTTPNHKIVHTIYQLTKDAPRNVNMPMTQNLLLLLISCC